MYFLKVALVLLLLTLGSIASAQQPAGKELGQSTTSTQDDPESCGMLYNKADSYQANHAWQMCYDTSKKYVETCPNDPNVGLAFDMMLPAMYQLGNTAPLRAAFLSWLESVLYLNTSDQYFCSVVHAMSGTLPIPNDTTPGHTSRATNLTLAIWQWMILNTDCSTNILWRDYEDSRNSQWEQWHNDPRAYKLDTTLPPLSTWGLDTLFNKHLILAGLPKEIVLISAIASPNPAKDETTVTFGLAKQAYIKLSLLDVLGHEIQSAHTESFFDAGNHTIPLSLHGLPSGTYYARLVTSLGETRTVKLVKE